MTQYVFHDMAISFPTTPPFGTRVHAHEKTWEYKKVPRSGGQCGYWTDVDINPSPEAPTTEERLATLEDRLEFLMGHHHSFPEHRGGKRTGRPENPAKPESYNGW